MKKILILTLLLFSTMLRSQNDLLAFNAPKSKSLVFIDQTNYKTKIDLHLNTGHRYTNDDRKEGFACILVAGLAFTAASLIEGGSQYGTYKNNSYVTPPFIQQTPRNIMFIVGVGLSITGIVGIINNSK